MSFDSPRPSLTIPSLKLFETARSTIQSSIKCSPFEKIIGTKPNAFMKKEH